MGLLFFSLISVFGIVAVTVSLFAPWLALALYGVYLISNVNPIGTMQRAGKRLGKLATVNVE
jgi:hypothetical protein